MVPDTEGVMAPARACHFNDAPWLAAESAQRMAHPGLGNEAAEALGCQSLRYHHQVCAVATALQDFFTTHADSCHGLQVLLMVLPL